ncbi:MAG: hypothetical protein WBA45_15855 [Microthrixaceae bacterium]
MSASPFTWAVRVLWLSLPLTLGDLFARILEGRSTEAVLIWNIALWAGWSSVLLASLILQPVTLTYLRVMVPLAAALGLVSLIVREPSLLGLIGLACALVAAGLTLGGDVGGDFVNGASYGDERRLSLRPPSALLLGPLQLVWLVVVGLPVAGVALLAAGNWIFGAIVLAFGAIGSWWGFRTLYRLATRWLVLVPAGLTVVDHLTMAEPTLLRRDAIHRLGPAPVDLDALDLTGGSTGLVVSVEFTEALSLVPAAPRKEAAEAVSVSAILLTPTRPGQLLTQAESRRIAVDRT